MAGRINMTQTQLEALVQAQVAAALAAAQAGSIPCSCHTPKFPPADNTRFEGVTDQDPATNYTE